MMAQTDLAWLAGFMDGEGCITISASARKDGAFILGPSVQITNSKRIGIDATIAILSEIGIDEYSLHERSAERQRGNVNVYTIHIRTTNRIRKLLKALLPYLVIKRQHAKVMLRYCERRVKGTEYTDEDMRDVAMLRVLNGWTPKREEER